MGNLEFRVLVRIFRRIPPSFHFRDAWDIRAEELSRHGELASQILGEFDTHVEESVPGTAWMTQALLEFQDLQFMTLSSRGPFLNINYLFYEALSTIREAFISGLNGQTRASLAVLRSALEMFVSHYWWRRRLIHDGAHEEFYEWLHGKKRHSFSRVIVSDTFKTLSLPPGATTEGDFRELYRELCSYVHKPRLGESLTVLRGGNVQTPSHDELSYWHDRFSLVQQQLLDVAIGSSPESLFAVDIYRKFGFNGPMGAFFDGWNVLVLERALGAVKFEKYRSHYGDKDPPLTQLRWVEDRPNLTDAEILASYRDEDYSNDEGLEFATRVFRRMAVQKARTRAIQWAFAYNRNLHSIDEIKMLLCPPLD